MTVKEEIDSMLKSMTEVVSEPEPEPVSEPEPQVVEEVKEPEPVPEPEEKAEEKVEELKIEEVKVEEPKVPEPDERDKTIADLRAKLAEKEVVKEPEKPIPPKPLEEQDFIGEVDLDELTRDPKEFNKVLNKIYQKAVLDTRSSVVETLPEIVKTNIQIMNELKATSENFYKENKDLEPFKKVVSVVFDEIALANPNKPYTDLIKEVAPEVRKRLDLKTTKEELKKGEVPKLPQKAGRVGRPEKSTVNPLQVELEEMNRVIGR